MMGLELRGLRAYANGKCLFDISTQIAPGEILSILGPSGSGKSTLLSAISGVCPPDIRVEGDVLLAGHSIIALPPHRRRVGQLFQDPVLFPHLDVGANLAFGIPRHQHDRAARVAAALNEIELPGFEKRAPSTLSGGQQTRVALMRCLLSDPLAVMLDEPFSNLDPALRSRIRDTTFATLRERALPTILVTHDQEDCEAADGAVLHLNHM